MNHYEEIAWTLGIFACRMDNWVSPTYHRSGQQQPCIAKPQLVQQYKVRTSLMLAAVQYQHLINLEDGSVKQGA